MAQRVREQIEARDRDHRDAQRLREHLRGRHADAQPGEHARADADRDRRHAASSVDAELLAAARDRGRERLGVARRAGVGGAAELDPAEHARASVASTTPTRRVAVSMPRSSISRAARSRERALERVAPARASAARGTTSSSTRSVSARRPGSIRTTRCVGGQRLRDQRRPTRRPSRRRRRPAPRSRGRRAPGSGRAGTRRRARRGTRPSYSCTIVNVGLVTGSVDAERRARGPCANVVLPAPRSPASTTRSPARSCDPSAAPTASRLVARRSSSAPASSCCRATSARFTCTKSARDSASALPPERSTADGCNVGISTASWPGARERELLPRSFVMPSLVSSSSLVAKLPSVTITRGRISASWRSSHGAHASISSGCGSRLPGGRHFTTFAMYTSARVSPMPSMSWVSSCPARPTNGSPLQVFLLARALADEHQVGVGAADAEHDLRAAGRELAQRRTPTPRPRPRRASRRRCAAGCGGCAESESE